MNPDDFDDFDRAIEDALASESLRQVPFGFHRNVDKRVRLACLIQRQRRHFRQCIVVAGAIFCGLTGLVAAAAAAVNWPGTFLGSIPGAMGLFDYAVAQCTVWGPGVAGVAVLVFASLGIGVAALEMRWARHGALS